MWLLNDVTAAIADAMREQDAARLAPLRMLKAAFMNKSVEKGRDLDDAEERQIVNSLVKQRRDSIEQFAKAALPISSRRKRRRLQSSKHTFRRRSIPPRSRRLSQTRFQRPAPRPRKTWVAS